MIALGRVVTPGSENPGRLYTIDPALPPGGVTTVASNLGAFPLGIAFDGARFFIANNGSPGSVSIVTPGASIPWTVTTVVVFRPGRVLRRNERLGDRPVPEEPDAAGGCF